MADWTAPKTDWVATDYFNVEDYTRIVGNIEYLKDLANELWGDFDITTMEDKDYTALFYASEMNAIETNLDTINSNSYGFDIGDSTTYTSNGATPLYSEFNRIESASLKIYKTLVAQKNARRHLAFTLGGASYFDTVRA